MPHYHFDLLNGAGLIPDEEGRDFPDLAAARRAAVTDIRSIMAEDVRGGRLDQVPRGVAATA